jgi:hypothetical protein
VGSSPGSHPSSHVRTLAIQLREAPLIRSPIDPRSIRALRPGHGANCSSIGSVVDTLFVTSLLGGAIFAAVIGALGRERIEVVGAPGAGERDAPHPPGEEPPSPKPDAT